MSDPINKYGQQGNRKSTVIVSVAPELEPIDREEVKLNIGMENVDDHDGRIDQLIADARAHVERTTARRLITQTLLIYSDFFPRGREIALPVAPMQSITSIQYYDVDGTLQVLSSASYHVDIVREPGRIALVDGEVWPETQVGKPNAVIITAVAGYGDKAADVPQGIVTAMHMMIEKGFDRPDENYLKALDRVQTNALSPYMLHTIG